MKSISQNIIFFLFIIIFIIINLNTLFSITTIPNLNEPNFNNKKTSLNGTKIAKPNLKLNSIELDSITTNKIIKIWYTNSELNIQIYQVFKQQEIAISVYNMLGKEVLEVFKGTSSSNVEETYSKTFNLPNGIYICIMQGKNFKSSEKFIISR